MPSGQPRNIKHTDKPTSRTTSPTRPATPPIILAISTTQHHTDHPRPTRHCASKEPTPQEPIPRPHKPQKQALMAGVSTYLALTKWHAVEFSKNGRFLQSPHRPLRAPHPAFLLFPTLPLRLYHSGQPPSLPEEPPRAYQTRLHRQNQRPRPDLNKAYPDPLGNHPGLPGLPWPFGASDSIRSLRPPSPPPNHPEGASLQARARSNEVGH